MTQEQVEALSVVEIKAMVYDAMVLMERCQNDIKALNQILAKKAQEPIKDKNEQVEEAAIRG